MLFVTISVRLSSLDGLCLNGWHGWDKSGKSGVEWGNVRPSLPHVALNNTAYGVQLDLSGG